MRSACLSPFLGCELANFIYCCYSPAMDKTIIKLQNLVQDQADEIASLSAELYTQQKELGALKKQLALILDRLTTLSQNDGAVKDASEETPPPHY